VQFWPAHRESSALVLSQLSDGCGKALAILCYKHRRPRPGRPPD
jgi:hypothetical protein